ncbi:hypothetical protein MPLSOD_110104 [Mesorhizobium sp. SOD10]|nr:hypothetical protein MPLSOD_110104 [Mesorhizobium sp. SOD10]
MQRRMIRKNLSRITSRKFRWPAPAGGGGMGRGLMDAGLGGSIRRVAKPNDPSTDRNSVIAPLSNRLPLPVAEVAGRLG